MCAVCVCVCVVWCVCVVCVWSVCENAVWLRFLYLDLVAIKEEAGALPNVKPAF